MILAHFFSLRHTRRKALKFANFIAIEEVTGERILSKNYLLLGIRLVVLFFLILAVAGTSIWLIGDRSNYDFVLTIDSSGSMLAQDFSPNRIEAAKCAANVFVDSVPTDTTIGVVSFAGVTFIKQKPTSDLNDVRNSIDNISVSNIGGTGIGSALINSINLMTDSDKENVILLITDGQNNVGPSIKEAINYAKDSHVIIHTIGIGTPEGGHFPNLTFVSKLDEYTLEVIANSTSGDYYRAENTTELENIYREIAETSEQAHAIDLSLYLLLTAVILLFVEWGLVNTKYRTIP